MARIPGTPTTSFSRVFLPLDGVAAIMSRADPAISSLPPVLALISDFLEFRNDKNIYEAYAATRSLLILRRMHEHERFAPAKDPLYRDWVFKLCIGDAAYCGDLPTVQWLTTEYEPNALVLDAVEAAATNGHLDVLKWLHDECRGRTMFGMKEMWLAAKGGHLDVLMWLHKHSKPYPALTLGSTQTTAIRIASTECLAAGSLARRTFSRSLEPTGTCRLCNG